MIAGAIIGVYVSTEKSLLYLVSQPKLWLLLFAILTPLTFVFNLGMKWYLKKLYGNHLARLHSILQELND